jgi:hypothetical protein
MGVSMQLLEALARSLAVWLVKKWWKWRGIDPEERKKEKKKERKKEKEKERKEREKERKEREKEMERKKTQNQGRDTVMVVTESDVPEATQPQPGLRAPKAVQLVQPTARILGPTADLFIKDMPMVANGKLPLSPLRLTNDSEEHDVNDDDEAPPTMPPTMPPTSTFTPATMPLDGDSEVKGGVTFSADKVDGGGGEDGDDDDADDDDNDDDTDEALEFTVLCIYSFVTALWILHMATVFQAREHWETLRDAIYWAIVTTTTIGFG